jgi:hypothetical protein
MNVLAAKRPAWFWIAAALALLWSLFGLAMFWMEMTITPEQLAQLPQAQRTMHETLPGWIFAVDGIANFSGVLAAIMLLLGRRLALPLYRVSLVAIVVLFGYCLFPGRMLELMTLAEALVMPILITLVGVLLVWFARRSVARGWIA